MATLEIDNMSFGPYGIGRLDGKSVMVPNSAPGDLLEVEILSARKHYSVARIVKILRPGPGRRIPPCPFLPRCGGCDWQQLSYEVQLEQKANLVESAFCRPLRVQVTNAVDLIVPAHAEFGYRSRVRLKVGNQGKLGFYELNSNELVEIDHCLVAAEQLVLEPAKALAKNLGKACQEIDLVRKEKRQVLVAHLSTSIADRHLSAAKQLLNRTDMVAGVVLRSDRERHTLGDVTISVKLEEGLAIEVNADAFSQVNHEQNSSMVRMVMEWAEISEGQPILDLFCGAGNFSLPAARRGAAVIGVDADEIAVLDAQRNATRLGFNSARFIAMAGVETANFLRRADYRPQLLVLDPPRTGARELIPMILKLRPSAVIYVSCDLATVRRDMESLGAGGYRVDRVKAFDFFPNTHHVELVARAVLT